MHLENFTKIFRGIRLKSIMAGDEVIGNLKIRAFLAIFTLAICACGQTCFRDLLEFQFLIKKVAH